METIIQKYLRNRYATISEYNAQAGEGGPEPFRVLVVANFPTKLQRPRPARQAGSSNRPERAAGLRASPLLVQHRHPAKPARRGFELGRTSSAAANCLGVGRGPLPAGATRTSAPGPACARSPRPDEAFLQPHFAAGGRGGARARQGGSRFPLRVHHPAPGALVDPAGRPAGASASPLGPGRRHAPPAPGARQGHQPARPPSWARRGPAKSTPPARPPDHQPRADVQPRRGSSCTWWTSKKGVEFKTYAHPRPARTRAVGGHRERGASSA